MSPFTACLGLDLPVSLELLREPRPLVIKVVITTTIVGPIPPWATLGTPDAANIGAELVEAVRVRHARPL